MTLFTDFFSGLIKLLFKLLLLAAALIFIASFLVAGVVVVVITVVVSLLTGRKPKINATFTRFRQASAQFRPGTWPGQVTKPAATEVVDVQAREVPEKLIGSDTPPPPQDKQP